MWIDYARRLADLPFAFLLAVFSLPQLDVAKKLGVCATVLKKICRKYVQRLLPAGWAVFGLAAQNLFQTSKNLKFTIPPLSNFCLPHPSPHPSRSPDLTNRTCLPFGFRNGISRWPHRKIKSFDKQIAMLEAAKAKGGAPGLKAAEELEAIRQQKDFLVKNPNGHNASKGMKSRRHAATRVSYHAYDLHSEYPISDCDGSSTTSGHHTRSSHRGSTDSGVTSVYSAHSSQALHANSSALSGSRFHTLATASPSVLVPPTHPHRSRSASVSATASVRSHPSVRSYSISGPAPSLSENSALGRVPRVPNLSALSAPSSEPNSPGPSSPKTPTYSHSHHPLTPAFASTAVASHAQTHSTVPGPQSSPLSSFNAPVTLPAFAQHASYPPYMFANPYMGFYSMPPPPGFSMDPNLVRYFNHFPGMPHQPNMPLHAAPSSMNVDHAPMMPRHNHPEHSHPIKPTLAQFGAHHPTLAFGNFGASYNLTTASKETISDDEDDAGGEALALMHLANTASPDDSFDQEGGEKDSDSDNSGDESTVATMMEDAPISPSDHSSQNRVDFSASHDDMALNAFDSTSRPQMAVNQTLSATS